MKLEYLYPICVHTLYRTKQFVRCKVLLVCIMFDKTSGVVPTPECALPVHCGILLSQLRMAAECMYICPMPSKNAVFNRICPALYVPHA